ncbi:MAG: hypothetical protein CMI18_01145 [Opitutaceae bacterium]|nr:hypothetical protein [Opitutaceae bacterium]|tara:strand:- start:6500 stop:6697 length:198 start_codon:yes stop_codon:yes gene_type:complete
MVGDPTKVNFAGFPRGLRSGEYCHAIGNTLGEYEFGKMNFRKGTAWNDVALVYEVENTACQDRHE